MKRTRSKKSRDTVPLKGLCHVSIEQEIITYLGRTDYKFQLFKKLVHQISVRVLGEDAKLRKKHEKLPYFYLIETGPNSFGILILYHR
jgi:hypothetical protein